MGCVAKNSNTKKRKRIIWNIVIPILIGGIIYYVLSPDVVFVEHIDSIIGYKNHLSILCGQSIYVKLLRNYFLDMLWAYALVFALYFIICNSKNGLLKSFLIAFSFSTIIEVLQLTYLIGGTFDVLDIMLQILAEVIAVLIIYIIIEGGLTREKEN